MSRKPPWIIDTSLRVDLEALRRSHFAQGVFTCQPPRLMTQLELLLETCIEGHRNRYTRSLFLPVREWPKGAEFEDCREATYQPSLAPDWKWFHQAVEECGLRAWKSRLGFVTYHQNWR